MDELLDSTPLRDYFLQCVRRTLSDLSLPDEGTTLYLADLLTRYGTRRDLGVDGVADRLLQIHRTWQIDHPDFNPSREVELRRDLGDYTLFMTGFLWERAEAMGAQHHYTRLGQNAYRFVAEHHRAAGQPGTAVYRALADGFMRYAVVLMYLREVYVDAQPARSLPARLSLD
jgi:hypothetical protein